MSGQDVATALQLLNFVKRIPDSKGNGQGFALAICVDWKLVESHAIRVASSKTRISLDPEALRWTPLVYTFPNNDDNASGSRGSSPTSADGESNGTPSTNNKESAPLTTSPIRKNPVAVAIASPAKFFNDVKCPDKKSVKRKKKRSSEKVKPIQPPVIKNDVTDSDIEQFKQAQAKVSPKKLKSPHKKKILQQLKVEVKEESEEEEEDAAEEEDEEEDDHGASNRQDSDSSDSESDEDGDVGQGSGATRQASQPSSKSSPSRKSKGSKDSSGGKKKSGSKTGRKREIVGNTIMDLKKKKMVAASMALIANATALASAAKRAKKRKPTVDSSSLDEDEGFEGKSKNMLLGRVLKARAKKVANLEEEEKAHRHHYQHQPQHHTYTPQPPPPAPPQQPKASLTTVSGSLKIEIGDVASVVKKLKKPKLITQQLPTRPEVNVRAAAIVEPVVVQQKFPSLFEKRRLSKSVEILPISPDGDPFVKRKEQMVKDVTSVTAVTTPLKIPSQTTAIVLTSAPKPVDILPVSSEVEKEHDTMPATPNESGEKEKDDKEPVPKVDPEKQKRDRAERYSRRLSKRTVEDDEGEDGEEPVVERKKMYISETLVNEVAVKTINERTPKQIVRKNKPISMKTVLSSNIVDPLSQQQQSRPRKMKKIRRHKGYKYWGTPPSHAKRKKKPVAIVAPSTSNHHQNHNGHQSQIHFSKQHGQQNTTEMEEVSCRPPTSPAGQNASLRSSPMPDHVEKEIIQHNGNDSSGVSGLEEQERNQAEENSHMENSSDSITATCDSTETKQLEDPGAPSPPSMDTGDDEGPPQEQQNPPTRRPTISMSSDDKVLDLDSSGFPIVRDAHGADGGDDVDGDLSEIKDFDIASSLGEHDQATVREDDVIDRLDHVGDDDDCDFGASFEDIRGNHDRVKEPDSESLRVIPSGPSSCNTVYDDSDLASQPSVPPPASSNGNNNGMIFDSPVMVDTNNRSSSSCSNTANNTNNNMNGCAVPTQQQMSPCMHQPPTAAPAAVAPQPPQVPSGPPSRSTPVLVMTNQQGGSAQHQQQQQQQPPPHSMMQNGNTVYQQQMQMSNMNACQQQQPQHRQSLSTSPMPPTNASSCQMMQQQQQQEMHNMGYSSGMTPQHQHSYSNVHSNQSCPPGSVEAMDTTSQVNLESPHSSIGSVDAHYPHGPGSVDGGGYPQQSRQQMYDSCSGGKYAMQHSPMVMVNPPTPQQANGMSKPVTPQQQQMNPYNSAPPTPQSVNLHHPSPPSQNNMQPHHNNLPQPSPPTPQSYHHHHSPPTPQPHPQNHQLSVPTTKSAAKIMQHQQSAMPMSPGCRHNTASPQNMTHYCQQGANQPVSPGNVSHPAMSPHPPHMPQQSQNKVAAGANSPKNLAQYGHPHAKQHSGMTQQQMMYQQMMSQQQQRAAHHNSQAIIQQRTVTPAPPMSPAPSAAHAAHHHSNSML